MAQEINWRGLEYNTTERCIIDADDEDVTIMGFIKNDDSDIAIVYSITMTSDWQPVLVSVTGSVGDIEVDEMYVRAEGNVWLTEDELAEEFADCHYVDISLTPFTNTLPIRSLELQAGESQIIKVLYFDVIEGEVKAVQQQYTCIDKHHYRFENVPNDFEAVITVDDEGYVVDYPGLFERV